MAGAKNITVIPARKRVGNTATADNKPKLKVAAYCRVSTDSEEQATSYDAQVEHYTEFIRNSNFPHRNTRKSRSPSRKQIINYAASQEKSNDLRR